jgi:hypothetical protein
MEMKRFIESPIGVGCYIGSYFVGTDEIVILAPTATASL